MDIITLGIIACAVGAAFCAVMAGAVASERPAEDNTADMLNLFGITPDNAHEFMWPVDKPADVR
jgi:hypothetical protein